MTISDISGRVGTFAPAERELNETEIRRDYGALLAGAVSAFEHDPSYLVDMAEHASLIAYKRALWEVRMEAQRAARDGECLEEVIAEMMRDRGIVAPARLSRGSRRKNRSDESAVQSA